MAQLLASTVNGSLSVSGDLVIGSSEMNVEEEINTINNNLNDSVIEQGVINGWTYRKWKSGISECWGTTIVTINSWGAWGSLYEGSPRIEAIDFPPSLFVSDDVAWQVTANSYIGIVAVESASTITKDKTPIMYLLRPNTSSLTDPIRVSMEAKGRWK